MLNKIAVFFKKEKTERNKLNIEGCVEICVYINMNIYTYIIYKFMNILVNTLIFSCFYYKLCPI